jgi:hypothetical protein
LERQGQVRVDTYITVSQVIVPHEDDQVATFHKIYTQVHFLVSFFLRCCIQTNVPQASRPTEECGGDALVWCIAGTIIAARCRGLKMSRNLRTIKHSRFFFWRARREFGDLHGD